MRRFLLIAVPSFLVGSVAGMAFWYLASPLWIDRVVAEELASGDQVMVMARGTFRDADGAHRGSGNAALVTRADGVVEVQFSDFEVTNGPDLEVWLSAHPDPRSSADVSGAAWLSLGPLRGNIGNQSYVIPAGTDLSQFRSVVIWCEQFGVLFSPAPFG